MNYAVGIDLGGTFIKFGVASSNGDLIYEDTISSQAETGPDKVIENIVRATIMSLGRATELNICPLGIGVGTPGIIDRANRIVLGGADNINGWTQIHLADLIEKKCQLPVWINNDANMMGLGEQAFGAAKNCSDVLFLTIGTGIGGAIIIDGKLFGGYDNRGTELGHIPLFSDGLPCSCGGTGCLEVYASTNALIRQFENRCKLSDVHLENEISGRLITKLYKEKYILAVESLNDHWRFLGRGIAGLVNIFSPQKVIVGGGISESGVFYIEKLNEEFQKQVMPDCAVNTKICAAKLGNRAGILGAAQFVFIQKNNRNS
ncbi:MAG: ROK family protein [Paludibacter sp.]|nr:ROK family protein [Paludibacter sp.]